ncbi:MAG: type II CRISPR-associated endonuclease Cas1 [Mycoplasmoidaceae bacterium]
MGWRIIEIKKNCHIKLFLDNILIQGEEKIFIPIKNIDLLLFTNNRTNISINIINKLAENNITCIFCDEYYLPSSQLIPVIGNHLTVKIFEKQINWSKEFKDANWKLIITQKIINQLDLILFFNLGEPKDIELFYNYINNIECGDPHNREGHAAKLFWKILFGNNFVRTQKNLIINAILNFGYTILNSMIARSIIKKGLDPRIGIFHKSVHNYFLLASDLIEPFRVIVDSFVYTLYFNNFIKQENLVLSQNFKQILIEYIANYQLKVNGCYQYLNNAIDIFIDYLINNKINEYKMDFNFEIQINEGKDEL